MRESEEVRDVPVVEEHGDAEVGEGTRPGASEVVGVEVGEEDGVSVVEGEAGLGEAVGGGAGAEAGVDKEVVGWG